MTCADLDRYTLAGPYEVERRIARDQQRVQKKGPLTDDDMEKVRHHPVYGFDLLENHTRFFRNPLLMVLQHHENGDGTDYPHGLHLACIHPWARILRIVDSYGP